MKNRYSHGDIFRVGALKEAFYAAKQGELSVVDNVVETTPNIDIVLAMLTQQEKQLATDLIDNKVIRNALEATQLSGNNSSFTSKGKSKTKSAAAKGSN
ncbi:hypothetical protein PIB30_079338 [Stylosanthes scabra]|uniref:Uncharacterized protein n=1 Tax=Stylosanthes scabra TaxID=79078 RepID=A0ABU6YNP6_9FABA|nr:hypothetical protein [Stylosanthes scabra]